MLYTLAAVNVLVWAGIVVVLVAKYRGTRDVGFLYLGLALVVWPVVATGLGRVEGLAWERLLAGLPVTVFPFSLASQGELPLGDLQLMITYAKKALGGALTLLGLFMLCRPKRRDTDGTIEETE